MRPDIDLPSCAATACIAAILLHSPMTATAQPRFDGVWNVRYERMWRSMHGETHVINESSRMILRVRGDSVFGSWEPTTDPGASSRPPASVRGVVRGDSLHAEIDAPPPDDDGFFSEMGREIVQFLKTYVHGMPPMTPHVDVIVRGDSLLGTNGSISNDGTKKDPPRPLDATRHVK
jgi:hypothetical protein